MTHVFLHLAPRIACPDRQTHWKCPTPSGPLVHDWHWEHRRSWQGKSCCSSLKKISKNSGSPGSPRASFKSTCQQSGTQVRITPQTLKYIYGGTGTKYLHNAFDKCKLKPQWHAASHDSDWMFLLYFKSPLTFLPVIELGSHMQQGQQFPATKHYPEHEGWGGSRGCGKLTRLRSGEKATTKARGWGHSDQDHFLENSWLVITADLWATEWESIYAGHQWSESQDTAHSSWLTVLRIRKTCNS